MSQSKFASNPKGRPKIGHIFIEAVGEEGLKQLGEERIDEVLMSLTAYPFGDMALWVEQIKECYNFNEKKWEIEESHARVEREMDAAHDDYKMRHDPEFRMAMMEEGNRHV